MTGQRASCVWLVMAALVLCSGCAPTADPPATSTGSYVYTDGVGRQVVLPKDIERVAPTGPLAQLVLFSLCPDKLVGLANMFSDDQFNYIDQKYKALPVLGNFYGSTLNLEEVIKAQPQVVIDVGDVKSAAVSDLDGIQAKTGIPTIFVPMTIDSLADAYQTLGQVTGEQAAAQSLAGYVNNTLQRVQQTVSTIPASARPTVYYGQDQGLTAAVAGTTHDTVIRLAGATNVAAVPSQAGAGTASISMEQLLLWDPDVILLAPGTTYAAVASSKNWQGLKAVKSGRYYEIPSGPYNFIDSPPSINQVLGAVWLANLLYPDVFHDDMAAQTQTFYRLFYHCDVTDAQVHDLLANSTYK